jgi:hypothetical protein
MGYAILWLESLAAALLFAAAVAALAACLKPTARYAVTFGLGMLILFAAGIAGTILARHLFDKELSEQSVTPFLLLIGGLMGVAGGLAWLARRWLIDIFVIIVLMTGLLLGGGAVTLSVFLRIALIEPDWLLYTASWTAVYLAAVIAFFILERRRRAESEAPPAGPSVKRILIPAVGSAAAFLFLVATFEVMETAVDRKLAAAGAEALAIARSLEPPPVPDERNAALVYEEAMEFLWTCDSMRISNITEKLDRVERPDFDPRNENVRAVLRQLGYAIALLRKADAMPECRYPVTYSPPSYDTPCPSLWAYKNAALLLACAARVNSSDGKIQEALDDIGRIRRLGRRLASQPNLIASMIGVAIHDMAAMFLEDVLAHAGENLKEISIPWSEIDYSCRWSIHRGVTMEKATFIWFATTYDIPRSDYNRFYFGERNYGIVSRMPRGAAKVFFAEADVASYRPWADRHIRLLDRPFHQSRKDIDRLGAEYEAGGKGLFGSTVLASTFRCCHTGAITDARSRLAALGLAAAAFHARKGRYPGTLDELLSDAPIPVNPIDPFTGKPLLFRAVDGGLVIYSVGYDGKDNGGIQRDRGGTGDGDDIVFCLGAAYQAMRIDEPAARKRSKR